MAKDERLLPLPRGVELQVQQQNTPASYAPVYEDEFNEGRSVKEYLNVILKRLWLILTMVVLTTAAVSLYMYKQPSIFQASTTLLIQPPKQRATSKESININFGQDQQYWATQIRLLQNSELMKSVVSNLGLYRDPTLTKPPGGGFISTFRSIFSSSTPEPKKEAALPVLADSDTPQANPDQAALSPEDQEKVNIVAGNLLGNLSVEPFEKTSLVSLKVSNTDAALAAKVADALAVQFIETDAKREVAGTEKTLEDLTKSIGDLQNELATRENERIAYMKDSNLPLIDKGQDLAAQRLGSMSAEWIRSENERRRLQNEYDAAVVAVARGTAGAIPGLNDNQAFQNARQRQRDRAFDMDKRSSDLKKRVQDFELKIGDLESKLAALRVKYLDEMPENQSLIKQIEIAKQQKQTAENENNALVAKETNKIDSDSKKLEKDSINEKIGSMRAKLQEAVKTEAGLRQSYLQENVEANQQGQAQTRMTTLSSEIDTKRLLLNTLTSRQKEVELAINTGRPDNIKITSKAAKPTAPIGPNRPRNVMVAFLVSLVAGIGLAFLLDYLDDSIRTSDEVGRSLGLPTLALIPHTSITEKNRRKLLPGVTGDDEPQYSPSLVSLNDNHSVTAEAYRHLRTSLLFSSAGKPPQTILITSSQPSEGKTTTAMNTAITLAQAGADVVIIDCDLRRPRLHQHFDLVNSHGLTNYLSGEKNPDVLLKPCPRLENLKVITSGPIPPNPTELLSSNEMKTLLTFLKGNFKHIIIDSPPAISFTDAAILSTLADGVVIVAMVGKSSTQLIKRFKQRLNNLGARIFGVVLNGIKPNSLEYGYYGYGYNQYYAYNDPTDTTTPKMEDSSVDSPKL
jgi:polysaccharide biosynthesis transport protein